MDVDVLGFAGFASAEAGLQTSQAQEFSDNARSGKYYPAIAPHAVGTLG